MKKIVSLVLVTVTALFSAVCLSACGQTPPTNPSTLTKEEYIEVFNKVTADCSDFLGVTTSSALESSGQIPDSEFIDVSNENQAKSMLKAMLAMVYFMRNICLRSDYTVKAGYDDCTAGALNESFDLRFKLQYDSASSQIFVPIHCIEGTNEQYFEFTIIYDFTADTVTEFQILGLSGDIRFYKFKNDTLKMLDMTSTYYEGFSQTVQQRIADIKAPARETNPEDYSVEYMLAGQQAMGGGEQV